MIDIKKYMLPFMFILIPFAIISRGLVHDGERLFFTIAFIVIVGSLIENRWLRYFLWYLAGWQFFIAVSQLITGEAGRWLTMALVPQQGGYHIDFFIGHSLYIAMGALIFHAVSKSKVPRETYFNVIRAITIIETVIALAQWFGFDPILHGMGLIVPTQESLGAHEISGSLGNFNFVAAWLAITLPLFFQGKWKWFILPMGLVFYAAHTGAAFTAAIIGSVYYWWPKIKARERVLGLMASILGLGWYNFLYHPHKLDGERFQILGMAFRDIGSSFWHIIFGFGPDALTRNQFPLHNEYVQCLYQFGLVGVALMLAFLFTFSTRSKVLFTCFLIACIDIGGNYALQLAPSAFLLIIITGLMEREKVFMITERWRVN